MVSLMPLWLQLFVILGKTKYARMTVLWLHSLELLSPQWRQAAEAGTFVHLTEDGLCVGADAKIEFVNLKAKEALPVGLRTFETIRQAVLRLNVADDLDKTVRSAFGLPQYFASDRDQSVLLPVEEKDLNDITLLLGQHLKWSSKVRATDFDQIWKPEGHWIADAEEEDEEIESRLRRDVALFVNEETATVEDKLPIILRHSLTSRSSQPGSSLAHSLAAAEAEDSADSDDEISAAESSSSSNSSNVFPSKREHKNIGHGCHLLPIDDSGFTI